MTSGSTALLHEQLAATREILQAIGRTPTQTEAICDLILRNAMRLAGCQHGAVGIHEGGNTFQCVAIAGFPEVTSSSWRGRRYEVHRSHFRVQGPWRPLQTCHEQARQLLPHVDPIFVAFMDAGNWAQALFIPLVSGDRLIGTFGITKTDSAPFSDEQIDLVQSFAEQATVALENARALKALERQNALQSANAEILRAIRDSRADASPIFDLVLRKTCEFTETDIAGLGLQDGDGYMRFVAGLPEVWMPQFHGIRYRFSLKALTRSGPWQSHYYSDLQLDKDSDRTDGIIKAVAANGLRSLLTIPLEAQGRIIGVIHACSRTVRTFSDEQIALVSIFASQVVIALENTRMFRELQTKNEQLEQASRHKSEFLANMSHELRTPLNAIIGFSEVMKDELFGELNEKQAEYAMDIHGAGHHLLNLINDVLDLAKVEAGRMELLIEPFDLPQAVDSALIMVRERANRQGVALNCEMDRTLGHFAGDERKFKQVLLNLLSNAVKFSPGGGNVNVIVTAEGDVVSVSVRDQGIGIPEAQQREIFEAFHQAESTLAVKREGTGLGLTLAKRFVELHGGSIGVVSQLGQGSTFTFSMRAQPWPTN